VPRRRTPLETEGREHDHAGTAFGGDKPTRRLDAVDAGHADVHEHDVGTRRCGLGERRTAGGCLPDDGEGGVRVDDPPETCAHEWLVVDEQDADRRHDAAVGNRATRRYPPRSLRPVTSVPP
jgi:hypothetical protein